LVSFLLNLRKGSNQDELDRFFEVLWGQPLAESVSKSALTQARAKLSESAFEELNRLLVNNAARALPMRRWHGFRLLAVDGSIFLLPNVPAIVEAFGQVGEVTPQARFSRLFDVLNHVAIGADVEPLSTAERVLAGDYLPMTTPEDLLLYDCGYPAFWLFALHAIERRHFCARVPRTFCSEIEQFVASGAADALVTFTPGDDARKQCRIYGLPSEPLSLRVIRVLLSTGEERS